MIAERKRINSTDGDESDGWMASEFCGNTILLLFHDDPSVTCVRISNLAPGIQTRQRFRQLKGHRVRYAKSYIRDFTLDSSRL